MRQTLPLHDAAFTGVMLQQTAAQLHFVRTDGSRCVVELESIDTMQMDDFREGNIVSVFELISGDVPSGDLPWDRLYPPPHPAAAQEYHQQYDSFLREKISKIADGQLTLVQMVPSYGADLLVVCAGVKTLAIQ